MVETLPAQSTIKKYIATRAVSITGSLAIRVLLTKILSCLKETCTTIFSVSPMLRRRYKTLPQLLKRKSACTPNINKKDKANFNQNSYMDSPFKIFDQNILAKTATTNLYITIK